MPDVTIFYSKGATIFDCVCVCVCDGGGGGGGGGGAGGV